MQQVAEGDCAVSLYVVEGLYLIAGFLFVAVYGRVQTYGVFAAAEGNGACIEAVIAEHIGELRVSVLSAERGNYPYPVALRHLCHYGGGTLVHKHLGGCHRAALYSLAGAVKGVA